MASQSGTVVVVSNNVPPCTGYGNCVIINGDNGYSTLYAHLEDSGRPVQGTRVTAGDVIGLSDTSGPATGPHLHFELGKTGGPRINPVNCFAPSSPPATPAPTVPPAYSKCYGPFITPAETACCIDSIIADNAGYRGITCCLACVYCDGSTYCASNDCCGSEMCCDS